MREQLIYIVRPSETHAGLDLIAATSSFQISQESQEFFIYYFYLLLL